MTKIIGILSSKGGSGKTSVSVNLGSALNNFGKNVVIFDGNFDSPHVGLFFGVSRVPVDIHNASSVTEAVYRHESGVKIVPGSIRGGKFDIIKSLSSLYGLFDYVVVDSGSNFLDLISVSDILYVVTTPDLPSVAEALKTIKTCENYGRGVKGVILNKHQKHYDMSVKEVGDILNRPVVSVIPYDNEMARALFLKNSVVNVNPKSDSSIAFKGLAANLLNVDYKEKKSFHHGMFKFLGLK